MNGKKVPVVVVTSMARIAAAVRDQRARMRASHADIALHADVSRHFVADIERAKPSIAIDKLLAVLAVMRIRIEAKPQQPPLLDDQPARPQQRLRARPAMRINQMHDDPARIGCLECGARVKDLRPHLARVHTMRIPVYRAKWNLPDQIDLRSKDAAARERDRLATRAALEGNAS